MKTQLILSENFDLMEAVQMDITKLKSMSDTQVKSAYLANLLASLLLMRVGDRKTQTILHDVAGRNLKSYKKKMSPLNFWGLVLYNSKEKHVIGNLSPDVAKSLHKTAGRIVRDTMKKIHYPLSNKEPINWIDMMDAVRIITLRLPLRNSRVNRIREGLLDWDNLSANDKSQIISYVFYYMMENDNNSQLLIRIRAISNSNLTGADSESKEKNKTTVKKQQVNEEGEGGGDAGGATVSGDVSTGTSTGDIAFAPFKLFKGKIVKRMSRGFTRIKKYEKKRKKKTK